MAKHTLTYSRLLEIDRNLGKILRDQPALALLLHVSINNFQRKADVELKILYKNLKEIRLKYMEADENGEPATIKDGAEFKFKESLARPNDPEVLLTGDKIKEAYEAEGNEFLARQFTLML
jgi:hypothetical protein